MSQEFYRWLGGYDDELPDWHWIMDLGSFDPRIEWRRFDEWPVA